MPRWFVEQTAYPGSAVTTPERRWGLSPRFFSLGCELPANLTGAAGRDGAGLPADPRATSGSGGQCLA